MKANIVTYAEVIMDDGTLFQVYPTSDAGIVMRWSNFSMDFESEFNKEVYDFGMKALNGECSWKIF